MVDDEIHGNGRIDSRRIATETLHGGAHGGEVHHGRHPGEVLKDDAGGLKWYFTISGIGRLPAGQSGNVFFRREHSVAVSENRF